MPTLTQYCSVSLSSYFVRPLNPPTRAFPCAFRRRGVARQSWGTLTNLTPPNLGAGGLNRTVLHPNQVNLATSSLITDWLVWDRRVHWFSSLPVRQRSL